MNKIYTDIESQETLDGALIEDLVQNMLDLSTVHMPGPHPEVGSLRKVDHEYGMIIFVPDEKKDDEPDWLKTIMICARESDSVLINFDRDAPTYSTFATYEW